MLFTHYGVSGPLMLSASSCVGELLDDKELQLIIDLKPALSEEQLDARILRDFEKYSRKQLINGLDDLLPKSLISVIIEKDEFRKGNIESFKFLTHEYIARAK